MSEERKRGVEVAELLGHRLMGWDYFPHGSLRQKYFSDHFVEHCSRFELSTTNPELAWRGFGGIMMANLVLDPPEDITVARKFEKGNGNVIFLPERVTRKQFLLKFWVFNVDWAGIRHQSKENWEGGAEVVGSDLRREPIAISFLSWLYRVEWKDATEEFGQGVYCVGAGKFRNPSHRVDVNVNFEGISI